MKRVWKIVCDGVALAALLLVTGRGLADTANPGNHLSVTQTALGQTEDGQPVDRYTLRNAKGMEVEVMTYGATITAVRVPDRDGKFANVTLYLDTLAGYLGGHPLFGALVGRYANRIAGAAFTLDGVRVPLSANAGPHHIHGGRSGFQRLVWKAEPIREAASVGVRFRHVSPDGHEGYPGELQVEAGYRLTDANELVLEYAATTSKPTHVNMTNHAYWNLAGAGSGDVLDHRLYLNADRYLPADEKKIPLGRLNPVGGTAMDFRQPRTIGSRIREVEDENYDHCYVLAKEPGKRMSLAARAVEPRSGRVMEVYTTQPGVQLYTAKSLNDRLGTKDFRYRPYAGFCLETQHFPNSPNEPRFPSTVLRPGERYHETTIYKFLVAGSDAADGPGDH